jgi:adenylyltransferase/sulfurtransferase
MSWLDEIHSHLQSTYPEEGCGVVFAKDGARRVVAMPNVYDKYAKRSPQTYPRTNKTAYLFEPLKFSQLLEAAEAGGETLELIFHSHCDVGSYFSAEDSAMAAPDGVPLYPHTSYLVVAVDKGAVTASKVFSWEGAKFVEKPSP